MIDIAIVGLSVLAILSRNGLGKLTRIANHSSFAWLMGFYAVAIASAGWSISMPFSGFRAAEVATQTVLCVMVIVRMPSFIVAEQAVLILVATAIALAATIPIKFHGLSLNLEHWHTNGYSSSAAILFCYCVPEWLRSQGVRRKWLWRFGLLGLFSLCLGTSSASFIAALLGLALAAWTLGGYRWPLVALIVLGTIFAISNPDAVTELLFPGKEDYQIATLHGRTWMWQKMADQVAARPVLGYGFAMGAKIGDLNQTNTHNSLFSVLLGTGLLGFLFVFVAGLSFLKESVATCRRGVPGAAGCFCAISVGLANSMSIGFLGEAWRAETLAFTMVLLLHILICRSLGQAQPASVR
jgi:O-antigen ligase